MRIFKYIAILFPIASSCAYAETIYKSYDTFYTDQPGVVFKSPLKRDMGSVYSNTGDDGVYTELQSTIDGRAVTIQVAPNHLSINKRQYRFTQATIFPNEHATDIYPDDANVFVTERIGNRPPLLCMEGHGSGSGEANRHQQIYVLVDPLSSKSVLLHLPSLLSSCRAVLAAANGQIAFPKNSYLVDEAQGTRTGLVLSYFTFERGKFMPTGNEIRLHFVSPENPFSFSRESKLLPKVH
ncbi:hypothetical protein [Paraburkholderia pallida]|uniref:Outer membrane lipoprotein-sorting protein n=1 Tax=Paraburkholderia pallida TaxID=2547399 RepID=A0A4P7CNN2_9BURK|nr:hypothetical protein [Paraburkholderia pallida]QBQ97388.1 hypothetical protein E1956_09525 [Paraburkholderia pallida]